MTSLNKVTLIWSILQMIDGDTMWNMLLRSCPSIFYGAYPSSIFVVCEHQRLMVLYVERSQLVSYLKLKQSGTHKVIVGITGVKPLHHLFLLRKMLHFLPCCYWFILLFRCRTVYSLICSTRSKHFTKNVCPYPARFQNFALFLGWGHE